MQKHTKIYMEAMGYGTEDFIICEIPKCHLRAQDCHHIENRGMGGTIREDHIDNLMALCREHHEMYGDKRQFLQLLKNIHNNFYDATKNRKRGGRISTIPDKEYNINFGLSIRKRIHRERIPKSTRNKGDDR